MFVKITGCVINATLNKTQDSVFKRQTKVTPVEFQEAKTFLMKFRSRSTSTEPQFSNQTDLTDLPLNENVQAFRL